MSSPFLNKATFAEKAEGKGCNFQPAPMGVCSELIRLPRDSIPNKLTGLCRDSFSDGALSSPRCYTENAALNGSWAFDNSTFKLPYVMQSSSWSTRCDKFVRDWMNNIAPAPDYMRYR